VKRSPMPQRVAPLRTRTALAPVIPIRPPATPAPTGRARPLATVTRLPAAATRAAIPARVRAAVAARDNDLCVRCCSARDLQQHHRRIKGHGGDRRPHTDCPCNIITLCSFGGCHEWAHQAGRLRAVTEGLIVPSVTALPGLLPVTLYGVSRGAVAWPSCDGTWETRCPDGAA